MGASSAAAAASAISAMNTVNMCGGGNPTIAKFILLSMLISAVVSLPCFIRLLKKYYGNDKESEEDE